MPNIHAKEDEPLLFCLDIAIQVRHEFMSIILDTATSVENDRSVDRAIRALARLAALIAAPLSCLQNDGSDIVRTHWQKLYLDMFTTFLPLIYNQLI